MSAVTKSKGPAEVAASPSHVITNPAKDQEMNKATPITNAATAEEISIGEMIGSGEYIRAAYVAAVENDSPLAGALSTELATTNNQVAAFPVAVLADATAKARYLLSCHDSGADPLSFDLLLAMLRSLDQEQETPLETLSRAAFEYRQAAEALEPDVVEWDHLRPSSDDSDVRFRLEGRRNLVPGEKKVDAA